MPLACIARRDLGDGELRIELGHPAAETLIDAPRGKIQILRPVVVAEQLWVEGDDIVYITVGHHHSVFLPQNILPRPHRRRALTDTDDTRLTIIIAESTVRLLHHIGSPYHFGSGPVHHDVLPVLEVLAHPHLCRSVAVTCTVGSGVEVIGVAKLSDGGVGEVARDDGVVRLLFDQFYHESSSTGHFQTQAVTGSECLLFDAVVLGIVVGIDAVGDDSSLVSARWQDVEREFDIPPFPVRLPAQIPVATVPSGYNNITT